MKRIDLKINNMERFTGEYVIRIKVSDIFVPSESTEEDLKNKIKKEGQRRIGDFIDGNMFDPDNRIITEEVIIKHKGI